MNIMNQIKEYWDEIEAAGGKMPKGWTQDLPAMQLAKLQDVWRKLQ